jgi:hypothetical protein
MIKNGQVKEGEMGQTCSANIEEEEAYMLLVEKPEGKLPLRRPRCKGVG